MHGPSNMSSFERRAATAEQALQVSGNKVGASSHPTMRRVRRPIPELSPCDGHGVQDDDQWAHGSCCLESSAPDRRREKDPVTQGGHQKARAMHCVRR